MGSAFAPAKDGKDEAGCKLNFNVIRSQIDVQFGFHRKHPMTATAHTESVRINLRTSPEAKALIERAAAIMGSTVSGFMLQNTYEAARRIVASSDSLVLSQAAFEAFVATCEKPPKPTPALRKLMALR